MKLDHQVSLLNNFAEFSHYNKDKMFLSYPKLAFFRFVSFLEKELRLFLDRCC